MGTVASINGLAENSIEKGDALERDHRLLPLSANPVIAMCMDLELVSRNLRGSRTTTRMRVGLQNQKSLQVLNLLHRIRQRRAE
jgi:hypothetical protein